MTTTLQFGCVFFAINRGIRVEHHPECFDTACSRPVSASDTMAKRAFF
jgi:hypothetical protein